MARAQPCSLKTYARKRRRRFIEAASAQATVIQHTIPSVHPSSRARRARSWRWTLRWAARQTPRTALVVISGTHGPEGYTGSACQLGFSGVFATLREICTRHHRVLLVHAHNPFGFAWMRRTTEGNVDLNRNYVDFNSALRGNPEYDRLHHAFVPKELNDPDAARTLAEYQEQHGAVAYMAAMLGGQRTHADGLFYGDTKPSWSRDTMVAGLQKHLAQQSRVVVIDIHTGLGPYGVPYLVNGLSSGRLALRCDGGDLR